SCLSFTLLCCRLLRALRSFPTRRSSDLTCQGAALDRIEFQHPLAKFDAGYDRRAPVYLGEYVTLDTGTGVVHSSPAYGVEDFLRSEEHTSELQSRENLVCRLLLEKKKKH